MSSFASLCGVVVANAPSYKSELVCRSMMAQVRRAIKTGWATGATRTLMIDALNATGGDCSNLSWVRPTALRVGVRCGLDLGDGVAGMATYEVRLV